MVTAGSKRVSGDLVGEEGETAGGSKVHTPLFRNGGEGPDLSRRERERMAISEEKKKKLCVAGGRKKKSVENENPQRKSRTLGYPAKEGMTSSQKEGSSSKKTFLGNRPARRSTAFRRSF